MKFIKLTELDGEAIVFKVSDISRIYEAQSFNFGNPGKRVTHVQIEPCVKAFYVQETVEDVFKMLGGTDV